MAKQTRSDRDAVKAKLAEERARQAALDRRRKFAFIAVGAVAIIAILGAVGVAIVSEQRNSDSATGATPAIVESTGGGDAGGIPNGPTAAEAEAAGIPTIDVWEDFQCPACKVFEEQSGPTLVQLAADKKARVVYHPMNLIGPKLSGDMPKSSSLRAASAFACTTTTDDFMKFHEIAFANQTEEGAGITDDQLREWASAAGAGSDSVKSCIDDQTYVGWAKRLDSASSDSNITSTPTVLVNGKELKRSPNQYTPAGLTAAVAAATTKK